jgi:hypothetical protein
VTDGVAVGGVKFLYKESIRLLASPTLLADSLFEKFIDPEDGMLDGSEFLLDYLCMADC